MKFLIVLVAALALAGCGSKAANTAKVDIGNRELRADVLVKGAGTGSKELEISFFLTGSVAPGVKTAVPTEVVAVDEPMLNGAPLTPAPKEDGQMAYKVEISKVAPLNEISAKLNGKTYTGKTTILLARVDSIISVMLSPAG